MTSVPASLLSVTGFMDITHAPPSGGTVHNVGPSTDVSSFPNLTTGGTTTTVSNCDTVLFAPGTYVNKGLIIVNTNDVLFRPSSGTVTLVDTSWIRIQGNNNRFHEIDFQGINEDTPGSSGIRYDVPGSGNIITSAEIVTSGNLGTAVRINGHDNAIEDSLVRGGNHGVISDVTFGTRNNSNCVVRNVTVEELSNPGFGRAIGVSGPTIQGPPVAPNSAQPMNWLVEKCLVQNNRSEPELFEIKSSGNTFRNNVIINNTDGHFSVRFGDDNLIENNWIENNNSFAGIRINGDRNVVRWNYIAGRPSGTGRGLAFFGTTSSPTTLAGNLGAFDNEVYCNIFNNWENFIFAFYQVPGAAVQPPSNNEITDNILFGIQPTDYTTNSFPVPMADFYGNNNVGPQITLDAGQLIPSDSKSFVGAPDFFSEFVVPEVVPPPVVAPPGINPLAPGGCVYQNSYTNAYPNAHPCFDMTVITTEIPCELNARQLSASCGQIKTIRFVPIGPDNEIIDVSGMSLQFVVEDSMGIDVETGPAIQSDENADPPFELQFTTQAANLDPGQYRWAVRELSTMSPIAYGSYVVNDIPKPGSPAAPAGSSFCVRVTNSTGQIVEGATVTLTDATGAFVASGLSNELGLVSFAVAAAGTYGYEATYPGSTHTRTEIEVT